MWAWPGLLLALTLLHVGGAESEGGGRARCQAPPTWRIGEVEPMREAMGKVTVVALFQASWLFCLEQAGSMNSLRQKLEGQGLRDIEYMVINHQGAQAQRLHPLLADRLTNITLYKQPENQPDVWQILRGEKDDFFIYDRCGRMTNYISLPYSIISGGYVEKAIRDAYCARSCGECTHESTETPEECKAGPTEAAPTADPGHHHHHHGHHHHGHHHDHGHHDHGHHHHGNHGAPPALGRHDGHEHHPQQAQQQPDLTQTSGHEHHHGNQQQQAQQQSDLTQQMIMQQVVMHRPWAVEKAKWKSKHSWQWAPESDNDTAPKASWCWHWRRLFGEAAGQWRCEDALPASWQWHGLAGGDGHVGAVTETWQWRAPPADWPQPRPAAPWAWPPNVQSWEWQQV